MQTKRLIAYEGSRCRDGYRIITKPAHRLEAASDRFEQYAFDQFPALFAKFVRAPSTPKGLREFADQFGLPDSPSEGNTTEQGLSAIVSHQRVMRRAMGLFEAGEHEALISLLKRRKEYYGGLILLDPGVSGFTRMELRIGTEGKLEAVIVPSNLIQAMWIQFLLHAASDTQLFRCERCAEPFAVGSGTKRRRTAKYCSNACKVAAFKARHHA